MYLAPIGIESVPYLPLSALINLKVTFIFYNTLPLAEEFSYQVQCGWLPTCACKHSHTSALIFMLHLFAYLCPSQTLQQWSMPPEARKSPLQCQLQPHTEDKEPSVHVIRFKKQWLSDMKKPSICYSLVLILGNQIYLLLHSVQRTNHWAKSQSAKLHYY